MLAAAVSSVASAGCYAVCSVLQHREAGRVPAGGVTLLLRLLRRPVFLLAGVVEVLGLGLQALALALGAVSLVQVLLVTGLLFAVPLSALLESRRATAVELLGAVLVVLGLGVFLLASRPTEGVSRVALLSAAPLGLGVLAVAAALTLAGIRVRRHRAALLGAAAGACYGLSSGLFKVAADEAGRSGLHVLATWSPFALVAVGGAGLLLTQNAFQSSGLGVPLAVLTLAEPVVAVVFGAVVLQEHLASTPPALAGEVVGALLAALGVVLLSSTPSARLRDPGGSPAVVPEAVLLPAPPARVR